MVTQKVEDSDEYKEYKKKIKANIKTLKNYNKNKEVYSTTYYKDRAEAKKNFKIALTRYKRDRKIHFY